MSRCFKTKTCEETMIFYFVKTWILESQKKVEEWKLLNHKKVFFFMMECSVLIRSKERNILYADYKNLSVDLAVITDKPHSYKQVFY